MYNYPNQYFFAKLCGMFPEWVCDFTGICKSFPPQFEQLFPGKIPDISMGVV
jgi:hypothetical protein